MVKKADAKETKDKPVRMDKENKPLTSYLVGGIKAKNEEISAGIDLELSSEEEHADEYLELFQTAEMYIEQLGDGTYTVGRLPLIEKKKIFYYLSVFHPLVSRIVNLHTKIPMSSIRIQKPDHPVDIVQDYVYDFYENLMSDTGFMAELKKAVRNYWIFGEGPCQIEDDFHFVKDTVDIDLDKLALPEIPQEDQKELNEINTRYNNDPNSVTYQEKLKVLKMYLLDINKDFKGIVNFKSIFPLDVQSLFYTTDIDFYVYSLRKPSSLTSLVNNVSNITDKEKKKLKRIGFSEALITKAQSNEPLIEIDSDPFNEEGVYIARLSNSESSSIDSSSLNALLEAAVQNLLAHRKSNTLVSLSSKIDRLVSAPDASSDQLAQLNEDLTTMAENPEGAILAVNFELTVEELSLSIKDSLDLDNTIERTNKEITVAMGMPEELISDGGTYGSGFLKVELLTNEYVEFRNAMKDFIENQIFKPIAIKKGFLTRNAWGDVVPLYPTIRFDRLSIARGSEDFSQMLSLVENDKLPVEVLYEALGYNAEDVEQKLARQQNTIFNKAIQDVKNEAISSLVDQISEDPEFKKRILNVLGINPVESDLSNPNEDGGTAE